MKAIMTQKSLSRKQIRWVMELQEYLPFNIIHISGKKNVVADALSRYAYNIDTSNTYEALLIDEALPVTQEELKEELDDLLADQQATSSASSKSLGDYL